MKYETIILSTLKKVIAKLDSIEKRLSKLEQLNSTPAIPYCDSNIVKKLNYYVGDNSTCHNAYRT